MYLSAFNLKKEIEFSDDGFNSIYIKDDGDRKIMLLALKKNQKIPEHYSSTPAYIYVIDGEIIFNIQNREYEVKNGEMFAIPENAAHSVFAKKDSKFLVIRM